MSPSTPSVSKGLATWLGVVLSLAQYAGALAAFLSSAGDQVALGALATATATLVTTIAGRMYQAGKAVEATAPPAPEVKLPVNVEPEIAKAVSANLGNTVGDFNETSRKLAETARIPAVDDLDDDDEAEPADDLHPDAEGLDLDTTPRKDEGDGKTAADHLEVASV